MSAPRRLFQCYGIELEYMIVDRATLDVRPLCDRVLHHVAGAYESEVEIGPLNWSNELVLHVIELKTGEPAIAMNGLAASFQTDVNRINDFLAAHDAMLLPTAMHPWMDPFAEAHLWPHEYSAVYEAFNRIFDCRGHGWSNLQCTHLNLPFSGDEEFGRLHAAIRLILPILPALSAASPVVDGKRSHTADTRLEVYRKNALRIPSMTGQVIPEPVFTRAEYEREILERLYEDLAPHDPEGVLRYEWANARGAIARFDRSTIEIRTIDIQECPLADVAILQLIVEVLRALVDERWCRVDEQRAWAVEPLSAMLLETIHKGEDAHLSDAEYLRCLGSGAGACPAGALWRDLYERLRPGISSMNREAIEVILEEGTLSRRMASALGAAPTRDRLRAVYRRLADCLATGRMFHAAG